VVQLLVAGVTLGSIVMAPSIALATCGSNQQTCSTGYGVDEFSFGVGGSLCDPSSPSNSEHSTNYCAKTAVGETGTGNSLGTLYQAQAGFNTDRNPSLTLLIDDSQCSALHGGTSGSSFDAGTLTTGSVAHVTGNFSVMSYLTSGYVVKTHGTRPSYTSGGNTHFLTALSNATPSAGTEGFGMNLVANTGSGYGGSAFGFGVSKLPDVTFSFGAASAGYNTADQFSYTDGAQIAASSKSSGVSCYFPSYVFAISNVTPAGKYTFNQSIVVTSTY
jgi:hypothetical protein